MPAREHSSQDGRCWSLLGSMWFYGLVCLVFGPSPASSRTSEYSIVHKCPKYLVQGLSVKVGSPPVSDTSKPVVVELQGERGLCRLWPH